jgi:hypothetical protein
MRSRISRFAWSSRRRRVASVVTLLALISASVAAAAFIIYSGGSGTAQGQFDTSQTQDALTFVAEPTIPGSVTISPLSPGGSGDLSLRVTNNTAAVVDITGVTATFDTTPAVCASHLSINAAAFTATPIPANASGVYWDVNGAVSADASTPGSCADGSFTANLTATTNP